MSAVEVLERPQIAAALQSDDPFRIVTAAEMAANYQDVDASEISVFVSDKFWKRFGEAGDRISLKASKPRNGVPTVEIVLPVTDENRELRNRIRRCRTEVVGVEIEIGYLKWAAVVDTASYKLSGEGKNKTRTLTVKCFGIYEILSYLLVWPNFLLPIQAQVPSHAVFIGPICTCIEIMISEQAFRIQSGLWELVNNAGSLNPDLRAWFGTFLASNGDLLEMLTTPIYVVHHNPLFDPSPFVEGNFRMETVAAAIDKMSKAYGITVDVELWRPGDPPPDAWFPHKDRTSPVYVVRVTDRSGITGPTSTFLDGILSQVVNLEGSVLGGVLDPFLNPEGKYAPEGVFIAPRLGIDFLPPWAVLIDHPNGPMETFEIVDHHPQAWQLVIGGKSPKVGAPPGNWGGTGLGAIQVDERPDQRDALVVARLDHDRDRNRGRTKQSARRVPQRRVPRVSAHRTVRPPHRHGAVRHPHRKVPGDRRRALQHRRPVHVHQPQLGHPRIPLGDVHLASGRTVLRRP